MRIGLEHATSQFEVSSANSETSCAPCRSVSPAKSSSISTVRTVRMANPLARTISSIATGAGPSVSNTWALSPSSGSAIANGTTGCVSKSMSTSRN